MSPSLSLLNRVRAEFTEMPGLRLRVDQAQRLWNLDRPSCELLLRSLVEAKFLNRTPTKRTGGPEQNKRPKKDFLEQESGEEENLLRKETLLVSCSCRNLLVSCSSQGSLPGALAIAARNRCSVSGDPLKRPSGHFLCLRISA